ncbi:MAG: hypothetical protein HYS65_16320 [Betaproteobacteria bacterium]|nr:hypothetical protein [Betaproteobacteria bacterium]
MGRKCKKSICLDYLPWPFRLCCHDATHGTYSASVDGLLDSLGLCFNLFSRDTQLVPLELVCRALATTTGLQLTKDELFAAGERVVNRDLVGSTRPELDAFRREQTKRTGEIVKASGANVR